MGRRPGRRDPDHMNTNQCIASPANQDNIPSQRDTRPSKRDTRALFAVPAIGGVATVASGLAALDTALRQADASAALDRMDST
jgi:hypothetical protein